MTDLFSTNTKDCPCISPANKFTLSQRQFYVVRTLCLTLALLYFVDRKRHHNVKNYETATLLQRCDNVVIKRCGYVVYMFIYI